VFGMFSAAEQIKCATMKCFFVQQCSRQLNNEHHFAVALVAVLELRVLHPGGTGSNPSLINRLEFKTLASSTEQIRQKFAWIWQTNMRQPFAQLVISFQVL